MSPSIHVSTRFLESKNSSELVCMSLGRFLSSASVPETKARIECVFAAIKHERVLRHSQESSNELALAPSALQTLMAETRDANTENLSQLLQPFPSDLSTFVA